MTDLIETVTTVPLVPTAEGEISPFWEGVLRESTGKQPHLAVERGGDPLWAVALFLLGAFLLVGAGAFLATIGFSR
jgi:hypothetical protein